MKACWRSVHYTVRYKFWQLDKTPMKYSSHFQPNKPIYETSHGM